MSLDPGVAAEIKAAADRAGAASISEYVEGTLNARMVRERWLVRWRAMAGDVDPEALAYARRALTGQRVEWHPRACSPTSTAASGTLRGRSARVPGRDRICSGG